MYMFRRLRHITITLRSEAEPRKIHGSTIGDHADHKDPPPQREHRCLTIRSPKRADPSLTPKGDGRFQVEESGDEEQVDGNHPHPMIASGQIHYLRLRVILLKLVLEQNKTPDYSGLQGVV